MTLAYAPCGGSVLELAHAYGDAPTVGPRVLSPTATYWHMNIAPENT